MPRITDIRPRRGTAAAWASANPVLNSGEMGLETDTKQFKFGDGTTTWNSLAYATNGEPVIAPGNTTQFWRGDKTWQPIENTVRTFAELQTAVAAGGIVRVDPNYPITMTSQIEITTPVHIISGKFVLASTATWSAFNVTTSNVTFDGCRFSAGGSTATYQIAARFISCIGTSTNKYKNIKITGCDMQGSQGENIRLTWVTHSSITNNTIDDYLYAAILLLSCSDMVVQGNTITNGVLLAPRVDVYGIACTDAANTEAGRSRNIRIIGNTVRDVDWEGIDTHGGKGIVIQGNIVTGCPRAIALVVGNETRVVVPIDNVVTGNIIDRDGALDQSGNEREGISLFGLSGNLADATIADNIIRGYTAANSLYLSTYVNHAKTLIQGNTHPHKAWTAVTMSNPTYYEANATYPPEFMVEGRQTIFRGFALSKNSTTANTKIGDIPVAFAPDRLEFMAASSGSHSAAGNGVIGVYPTGEVWMLYKKGGDQYSYPIHGFVQRTITP